MEFTSLNDLVEQINQSLGDFCNEFQYKRKELLGMKKVRRKDIIFEQSSDPNRDWSINTGSGNQLQMHIQLRNGYISYGLGFNAQYVPFANEKKPEEYIQPYADSFLEQEDLEKKLFENGFEYLEGDKELLKKMENQAYVLIGKKLKPEKISNKYFLDDSLFNTILNDIKGIMYTTYVKVIENTDMPKSTETNEINDINMNDYKTPLNLILYGPPGTGKTYHTINKAIEIANPNFDLSASREETRKEFQRLVKEEQVVFTSFHQSMSYEDFVEGIKPKLIENQDEEFSEEDSVENLGYKIEAGIFTKVSEAASAYLNFDKKQDGFNSIDFEITEKTKFFKVSIGTYNKAQDKELYEYCLENDCIAIGYGAEVNYEHCETKDDIREKYSAKYQDGKISDIQMIGTFKLRLNIGDIVFVSNGLKQIRAIGRVTSNYYYDENTPIRYNHFRKVEWLLKDEFFPVSEVFNRNLAMRTVYEMEKNGIKKSFFEGTEIAKKKNFVLIIDEINRGNISKIFGELITLLEEDKRAGNAEETEVILPYSKQAFKVPNNLYVLGTMNTADRSIALLDTALRRRFDFEEMMPKADILNSTNEGIDLKKLLNTINERIEFLYDRDHTIGHSYFIGINTHQELCNVFRNKVIPLLQEYFYNDWTKVQLVLGDNKEWKKDDNHRLVQLKKFYEAKDEKALFGLDLDEYEDITNYEVNPALQQQEYEKIPAEAFRYIYEKPNA